MPPEVKPRTNRIIGIEDIDRGVKTWFERVLALSVKSPQGDRRPVTVKFASGERWVASADRQGIRDRDGRLILPVIQIRRTGLDPSGHKTALGSNIPRLQIAQLVSEKTSDLSALDDLRPISNRRLRDSAVYDIFTVPFPSSNVARYKVQVQTQYQTHMNEFMEKFIDRQEFFEVPSFVISLSGDVREQGISTGDGSTERKPSQDSVYDDREPLSDYYVVGYLDGPLADDSNMDEFTDQERILQLTFEFIVPVALMLDPDGTRPHIEMQRTAFGVTLLDETVHIIDSKEQADKIFGREK